MNGKHMLFEISLAWVQILTPPFVNHVTLGSGCCVSEPQGFFI